MKLSAKRQKLLFSAGATGDSCLSRRRTVLVPVTRARRCRQRVARSLRPTGAHARLAQHMLVGRPHLALPRSLSSQPPSTPCSYQMLMWPYWAVAAASSENQRSLAVSILSSLMATHSGMPASATVAAVHTEQVLPMKPPAAEQSQQVLSARKPDVSTTPPLEQEKSEGQGIFVSQLGPSVPTGEADEGEGEGRVRHSGHTRSRNVRPRPASLVLASASARAAVGSQGQRHRQLPSTVAEELTGKAPNATPPFWHSLPSAPVVQEVQASPQLGSVPALPKLSGLKVMSATHQGEMSWENAAAL